MNLEEASKTILVLEYLGIQMEDILHEDFGKSIVKFSVPERSELSVSLESDVDYHTAEGLMKYAKQLLIEDWLDDLGEEFKDQIADYVRFYAKVRKGEVWNEDLAYKRLKEITSQIAQYREI